MKTNGRAQAITRLIVTAVLFINAILTAMGKNPIPLDESAVGECVSLIVSGIAIVWAWWKNANITREALYWQNRKNEARKLEKDFTGFRTK